MLNVVTTCLFTTHVIWKAVGMLSYGSIYAPMTFVSRVFMGLMMLHVAVSTGKAMIALFFGNAKSVADLSTTNNTPDFSAYIMEQGNVLKGRLASKSRFSAVYIRCKLARLMNDCLGVYALNINCLKEYRVLIIILLLVRSWCMIQIQTA